MRITFRRSAQAAVEDDLYFPGVAHRLIDGLIHIDHVFRPGGDHPAEPLQGLAHLDLRQGSILGIILVPPFHGYLDGRFVAGLPAHAHPAGMIARMPDGRCARPFRSSCSPRGGPPSDPSVCPENIGPTPPASCFSAPVSSIPGPRPFPPDSSTIPPGALSTISVSSTLLEFLQSATPLKIWAKT